MPVKEVAVRTLAAVIAVLAFAYWLASYTPTYRAGVYHTWGNGVTSPPEGLVGDPWACYKCHENATLWA